MYYCLQLLLIASYIEDIEMKRLLNRKRPNLSWLISTGGMLLRFSFYIGIHIKYRKRKRKKNKNITNEFDCKQTFECNHVSDVHIIHALWCKMWNMSTKWNRRQSSEHNKQNKVLCLVLCVMMNEHEAFMCESKRKESEKINENT